MIQPSELRPGNYFHAIAIKNGISIPDTATIFKVVEIHAFYLRAVLHYEHPALIKMWQKFAYRDIAPVSLTPELLTKCGFVHNEDQPVMNNVLTEYDLTVPINGSNKNVITYNLISEALKMEAYFDYTVNGYWASNNFKYLHQLQNLYFALTGEELNIKL